MTEQERTARLEGILEAWNRVLDRHEDEMRELRRSNEALAGRMDRIDTRLGGLEGKLSQMKGWLIGAVGVLGLFTAIDMLAGLPPEH